MHRQHILVVEDSDEDFETVHDAARRGGVSNPIVRASSGGECLRLLRGAARRRDALPALVLLDLSTPGEDGREALCEIRNAPSLEALPLVVLSGSANPRDLEFCYRNGANAYHVKPVDHAAHLRVLQQIFAYWLGSVVLPA
jgi:CheY-like chemotaxis protein